MNDIYDPNDEEFIRYRQKYFSKCNSCGKNKFVLTQRDNDPEYSTDVYFECECGSLIYFSLPVN